jgi:hypothetical protein
MDGQPGNFEVIRDALARMDPETRHETIEAMRVFRTLPKPAAVRVLLNATARAQLRAGVSMLAGSV